MQTERNRQPKWLITDNAGEYTSKAIAKLLADINRTHVPIVAHNSKENGVAERFNQKIMNAVRAALRTTNMTWHYWKWALEDATDKYNQLPHRSTGKTPYEIWHKKPKPNLENLYIFGQLWYIPVMSKQDKQKKHNNRGVLVRYLCRDELNHMYVVDTHGVIKRHRKADFHPYFSKEDRTVTLADTLKRHRFNNEESTKDKDNNEQKQIEPTTMA